MKTSVMFVAVAAVLAGHSHGASLPLFNSGVDATGQLLAEGATDPRIIIVDRTDGLGDTSAYVVPVFFAGYYLPNGPTSMWLSAEPDPYQAVEAEWTYRIPMDLTGFDPATVRVEVRLLVDNEVVWTRLNGVDIGYAWVPVDFLEWDTLVLDEGFQEGVNQLDFRVADDGVVSGFRVELTGTALPVGGGQPGRIVVANDDWPLSDAGYHDPCDPARFARNVAAWFTDNQPGRFLVYSTHFALTGSMLSDTMTSAGHTWIIDASVPFTLPELLQYDGVFVGATPADNVVLADYVNSGGKVYVLSAGNPGEPNMWNAFLQQFGLQFEDRDSGSGDLPVASPHPVLAGVDHLYQDRGNPVTDLAPQDGRNLVLATGESGGLYAVWDGRAAPETGCADLALDLYPGISITATPGTPVRLEWATDVEGDIWLPLAGLVVQDTPQLVIDTEPARQEHRFYRVRCGAEVGLVALGTVLFDDSSDGLPADTYWGWETGVRIYQGYGSLAGHTLEETISLGEAVAGVACVKVEATSTLPGWRPTAYWYARDVQGDLYFLKSAVDGIVQLEISPAETPPLALPVHPALHQCWPSYLDSVLSVRDLNAGVQGFDGLVRIRVVWDDDSLFYNFYQVGVGKVVIQTSKDPAPAGSGWARQQP